MTPHRIDTILPDKIFEAAQRVIEANRKAGLRVAVAESCTGGLVGTALTEVAGSSDVFESSFVTYSNEAKIKLLDVHPDLIETFGAVSPAVAWAMATGAVNLSGADVAVSITGVAGPGGASKKKPAGTVVFAKARRGDDPDTVTADQKLFTDNGRGGIRLQAALWALELLMPDREVSPAP